MVPCGKESMCYFCSPWFPVAKKICAMSIVHGSLWQRKYVLCLLSMVPCGKENMCNIYSPWFPVAKKICVIYIVHGSLCQRKYVLYI